MGPLERFLTKLDDWPFSAVWRVAFGLALPPLFTAIAPSRHAVWAYLAFFVGVLLALRVVPALLRHILPVSAEAKEIWRERRFIAKEYDSYQWQKLFWIGLGMLPHAFTSDGLGRAGLVLESISLIGGAAGVFFWHKNQRHSST